MMVNFKVKMKVTNELLVKFTSGMTFTFLKNILPEEISNRPGTFWTTCILAYLQSSQFAQIECRKPLQGIGFPVYNAIL